MFDANGFRDADASNPGQPVLLLQDGSLGAVAGRTGATVLSGTNTNDLELPAGPAWRRPPRRTDVIPTRRCLSPPFHASAARLSPTDTPPVKMLKG
jgi:hypothetical protein